MSASTFTAVEGRRARAHAQLLGAEGRDVSAVVRRLVGVQAQEPRAAALSIRARTKGLALSQVDVALASDVVLTWTMRGTRHLACVDDARWLLGLLAPLYVRQPRREKQLGIDGTKGDRAVAALVKALRNGPITRSEAKTAIAGAGVDVDGQAPIHVIARAALEGALVILPGTEDRYVALDDRVPRAKPIAEHVAAAELLRRYLVGYGPATPADFLAWSGLRAATAKRAWDDVDTEPVDVDGTSIWRLRGARDGDDDDAKVPLRLVGGFDALILGYVERSLHLDGAAKTKVNAGGGLVRPCIVDDGFVRGTWKIVGGKIELAPFAGFSGKLDAELADVRRFLAG